MTKVPQPLIVDVKRNSLDDGPGIRSVVFFKGCPLSCVWCHNPECISTQLEISHRQDRCLGCSSCVSVCPAGAIETVCETQPAPPAQRGSRLGVLFRRATRGKAAPALRKFTSVFNPLFGAHPHSREVEEDGPSLAAVPNGVRLDRDRCTLCGLCGDKCPADAMSLLGRSTTPQDLVAELLHDRAFFENSGGGVTLSGGEPTMFAEFAGEVAAGLEEEGVHVCLETCGHFDWSRFEAHLMPHLDLVYVDLKLLDATEHKKYTGRRNERILANIERLLGSVDVLIRIPLIPGITARRQNLEAAVRWLTEHQVKRLALLPYNPTWYHKAMGLGRNEPLDRQGWMSSAEKAAVLQLFAAFELHRPID